MESREDVDSQGRAVISEGEAQETLKLRQVEVTESEDMLDLEEEIEDSSADAQNTIVKPSKNKTSKAESSKKRTCKY